MKTFTVKWIIELDANTKEEAAKKALEIQRDPDSIATEFLIDGQLIDAAEEGPLTCADINDLFEAVSSGEQVAILEAALNCMQSYNGRSRTDCIAMAMGYNYIPGGKYRKVL